MTKLLICFLNYEKINHQSKFDVKCNCLIKVVLDLDHACETRRVSFQKFLCQPSSRRSLLAHTTWGEIS